MADEASTEYVKDLLERVRAMGVLLAIVVALWVWLIATLLHKGLITWDDLALNPGGPQ